jgi:hypothetical protein
MKDILKNLDKPWSWWYLSLNSNITMKDILKNLNKPWHWNVMTQNPNITIKDILENPILPWDWRYMSGNQNITIEFIEANIDKQWDWTEISRNKFNYHKRKKEWGEAQMRDKAARIIQAGCEDWIWKPVLKDGTPGIKVRLLHKHFEAINQTIAKTM